MHKAFNINFASTIEPLDILGTIEAHKFLNIYACSLLRVVTVLSKIAFLCGRVQSTRIDGKF